MAKEKVLVIDDEEDACWLVSKILQDNNFSVITAVTGSDGSKELQAHVGEIGLVFLDLRLPDVDGLLLCKTIREKNIPVAIMTAYGNETARESAKAMAVVDFIDKPLKVERILEIARKVIGGPGEKEQKGEDVPLSGEKEEALPKEEITPLEKEAALPKEEAAVPEKKPALPKVEITPHKKELMRRKKVKMPFQKKVEQELAAPSEKAKKPVVSAKFLVFIAVFVLFGGIFYKGKMTFDKANQFFLRGDYMSSLEWYVRGLTINPWNKNAKEKIEKAKHLIGEKVKKQAQKGENLGTEISEMMRELGERNEKISNLSGEMKEMNSIIVSMKKKNEEVLKEIKNKHKVIEKLNSANEKLISRNKALNEKFEKFDEESKKSLQKVELLNQENLSLHETINEVKKEAAKFKEKVFDLEPDAIRVRAVDEMVGNIKRERARLLREKIKFMKLKNTRAILKRKENPHTVKEEMELEENPVSGGLPSALNFIKAGDYDDACRVLANILAEDPDNEEAKLLLNMVISTSTAEDTTKYFQKFLRTPQTPAGKPSLQKALEYIANRQYENAEEELTRLLDKEPSNTIAGKLILRVRVLRKLSGT